MPDPFDNRNPRLMEYDPEKPSLWQLLSEGHTWARIQASVILFLLVFGLLSLLQ